MPRKPRTLSVLAFQALAGLVWLGFAYAAAPALSPEPTAPQPAPLSPSAAVAVPLSPSAAAPLSPSAASFSAPAYLTATAGNRSVLLGWYPAEGQVVAGYHIYRGEAPDAIEATPINLAPVTEPSFSDSESTSVEGPQNRATYFYRVRAYNAEGLLSPYSEMVSARPSGPLLPPAKFQAVASQGKVSLSWSAPLSTGEDDLAALQLLRGSESGKLELLATLPPEALSYEDSGLKDGSAVFYALRSQDKAGRVSPDSAELRAVPFRPLGPPRNLSALGVGDEAVRLKWAAPEAGGSFKVKGYNIYRSTSAETDLTQPINKALVPGSKTRYEDGPDDSVEAPKKGTVYRYTVIALDEEDNPSPPAAASSAGPVSSITKLETGEIALPQDSALQIQGLKSVDGGYTWTDRGNAVGATQGFDLQQRLKVNLRGKVGRKIKVDVDYDDDPNLIGQQQQKISVVYTGDQAEVFKEFAFGDIQMDLGSARTEFAGYNESLFGAKLKLVSPDERLRLTAVGAQPKGHTETKRVVGGFQQAKTGNVLGRDYPDTSFIKYQYYYLTRDRDLVEGADSIEPDSVRIFIDKGAETRNQPGNRPVQDPLTQSDFYFVEMNTSEFVVDYNTGLVRFAYPLSSTHNVAVAFRIRRVATGAIESVGYEAGGAFDFTPANMTSAFDTGKTSSSRKLIQHGTGNPNQYDSHMSMQFYNLGDTNIVNPKLDGDFKLVVYGPDKGVRYQLAPQSDYSRVVDFDTRQGIMRFRLPFPFNAQAGTFEMDPLGDGIEAPFNSALDDAYRKDGRTNFSIHVEYKYKQAGFLLRPFIVRGSELITLDGRRLVRDADYFLDYDSGNLSFNNPDLVKPDSVIEATYEYLPGFGGQINSTIWGARGEYDITKSKSVSVGSTFLWRNSDNPLEVPDLRSAPYSLQVLDGDLQLKVSQDLLDAVTRAVPLVPKHSGVLAISGSGEIARSWYKPNTYGKNNESGVAMLDNFEAIDDISSVTVDRNAWVPASRPKRTQSDPGPATDLRQFTHFSTQALRSQRPSTTVNDSGNKPQAVIDWAGFGSPDHWDGYMVPLGTGIEGLTLKNANVLEIYLRTDTDFDLHLDVGAINEDATGDNIFNTESTTGILLKGNDTGLLISSTAQVYPLPEQQPGRYKGGIVDYWGRDNKVVTSEDLDNNGSLNRANNFYSFSTRVSSNGNAPQVIRIALTDAQLIQDQPVLSLVPGSINYYANLKALRFWIDNAGGAGAGRVEIETIQFKGTRWQVRTDTEVTAFQNVSITVDTTKFRVSGVSREIQGSAPQDFPYVPNMDFNRKETTGSETREQSLQVEYALTRLDQDNGRPYFQARKELAAGGDVDLGNYKKLRLDLYRPHATLPGERLLVRLGSDDENYFEYFVALDDVPVKSWTAIAIDLDGDDGKRKTVGRPSLRQLKHVAVAVHTLNNGLNDDVTLNLPGGREILWIDNLRLTDAEGREGGAQRATMSYNLLEGKIQVDHSVREVDSDFIKTVDTENRPNRHEISQVVDSRLNVVPSLPMSVRYEDRQRFTDPSRRDDRLYSRGFVDPDEASQRTAGTASYTGIPGLNLSANGSIERIRRIFVEGYKEDQRISTLREAAEGRADPRDVIVDPDNTEDTLYLGQSTEYMIPERLWLIGKDTVKFGVNYNEYRIDYDIEPVNINNRNFRDRELRTRTFKGNYLGTYKPASWVSLEPSYAYALTESQGNVPEPAFSTISNPYYRFALGERSADFLPQSREISPQMRISFSDLGLFKVPVARYSATQTRDYVRNDLRNTSSLDLGTTLDLKGVDASWDILPPFELSQTWLANSVVNNDDRVRGSERERETLSWLRNDSGDFGKRYDLSSGTRKVPNVGISEQVWGMESQWWVRMGEDVKAPLNIENLAQTASRSVDNRLSTRFNLTLAPGWNGAWTPRWTTSDQRTMNGPEQVTRLGRQTLGTGLDFQTPHIPFHESMKPQYLALSYDFSTEDNYTVRLLDETRISSRGSHRFQSKLPTKPTQKLTITYGFNWLFDDSRTYNTGGGPEGMKTASATMEPSLSVVYLWNVDSPWKMPDMWPFYGKELRIRQNFNLVNELRAAFSDVEQPQLQLPGNRYSTTLWSLDNNVDYDLLQNVKFRLGVQQRWNSDSREAQQEQQSSLDYYAITLKVGLEANF